MTKNQAHCIIIIEMIILYFLNRYIEIEGATYYIAIRLLISNILGKIKND